MSEYRLEMRGVCKSFTGVKALDHAQLCLHPGKVHALMGENGAGKSTLMKCMFGIYSMDEGEIYYEGQKVTIKDHQLSGTCQSARLAAAEYREFYVVDSGSVTIGAGILAEYALNCADSGMSAREIAAALEEKKKDICLIAMLDTLEYLKRGGRISAAVAFAGGLLNIKPVVNIEDGVIHILGKARGSRQANNLLVQEIGKAGGIDFSQPILLGYTGLTDALLKKYIADSTPLWEKGVDSLRCTVIGSVIGTHAGPGAVAAAFFRKP